MFNVNALSQKVPKTYLTVLQLETCAERRLLSDVLCMSLVKHIMVAKKEKCWRYFALYICGIHESYRSQRQNLFRLEKDILLFPLLNSIKINIHTQKLGMTEESMMARNLIWIETSVVLPLPSSCREEVPRP